MFNTQMLLIFIHPFFQPLSWCFQRAPAPSPLSTGCLSETLQRKSFLSLPSFRSPKYQIQNPEHELAPAVYNHISQHLSTCSLPSGLCLGSSWAGGSFLWPFVLNALIILTSAFLQDSLQDHLLKVSSGPFDFLVCLHTGLL